MINADFETILVPENDGGKNPELGFNTSTKS